MHKRAPLGIFCELALQASREVELVGFLLGTLEGKLEGSVEGSLEGSVEGSLEGL